MLHDILTIMRNRHLYEKYGEAIKDNVLSGEGKQLFTWMGEYLDARPHVTSIDIPDFAAWVRFFKMRGVNPAQKGLYDTILDKLKGHAVDATNVNTILEAVIEASYAGMIHERALRIIEGDDSVGVDEIEGLLKEYHDEVSKYTTSTVDYLDLTDLDHIIETTMGAGGLNWRIRHLNECLGPIRKGHFIVIGARPDSGKTTFLVSEAVNWMKQLTEEQCILWLNNEETAEKVGRRMYESALGRTADELKADPVDAVNEFKKVFGSTSKLRQIRQSNFTVRECERLIKKHKPAIIIFDQLRKVNGFSKEAANEVGRQELLFAWARGLAAEWGPVLTVHQLGGTADGEKYPRMSDLYGSQTAIQGEADAIIFIGRSRDPVDNEKRFFSLPKNKLGDGVTGNRNARFVVGIDNAHACFEEVGTYEVL